MKKIFLILGMALAMFQAQANETSTTLKVSANDINMTADGSTITKLTFKQSDPGVDYCSFQVELTIPEGVKIAQVKSGRTYVDDLTLNATRFEGLDHSIAASSSNTLIKIACSSNKNSNFYNDDESGNPVEELFTIGLTCDNTLSGEHEVTVKALFNKVVSGVVTGVVPADPVSFKLTVSSTAINEVNADAATNNAPAYNLAGQRVNNSAKGILIQGGKKIMK